MPLHIAHLRALLTDRFPDAVRAPSDLVGPVATGVASLDAVLPSGGLPRGRLTAWAPGGGAQALLRTACTAVAATGARSAWLEIGNTIPPQWTSVGGARLLIRMADPGMVQRAAEELLRSGAFALVVLVGAEARGTRTVRLAGAAHEGHAAAVALTEQATAALIRLTSRLTPSAYRLLPGVHADAAAIVEAAVAIRVRAPGWHKSAVVPVAVRQHDLRLSLDPGLADRRGIAR